MAVRQTTVLSMANVSYNLQIDNDQLIIYSTTHLDRPMDDVYIVSIMVLAWFLLIAGFSFGFCNQCMRNGCFLYKWSCCGLSCGGTSSIGDSERGDVDSDSISTIRTVRDRTSNSETVEVCRNCPPNYEVESLPSYTIVSGLPTYDDAIEEFRKAGIILTPPMPIIKIFEAKDSKDIINIECGSGGVNEGDTISLNSISNNCTCGGGIGGNVGNNLASIPNNNNNNLLLPPIQTVNHAQSTQFIELTPDQLAHLSQKRLSLQIAFPQPGSQFRRNSRPRVDMRNHLLRSRASGTNNNGTAFEGLPQIHRTSSTFSLNNERHMTTHMQHRGSLY
ncbi:comm3 isoform X2 [Haematobia irritans]|uniref:comm3 isoform X2 n=1 Tax=Haematobia irritans TaxID=7368 RepID=UPI003F4F8297